MSTQPPHNKRKLGRGSGRNRNPRGNNSGSIQNSQSHSSQAVPGVYSNAHFVHTAAVLKGIKVQVQVISDKKYEGIFSTISQSAEVVLEVVHMIEGNTNEVPNKDRVIDKLVIKAKDIVSLTARDVDVEYAVKSDSQSGFMTDGDISGKKSNGQAGERELEQWTPSNDASADLSLDGDTNGWSVEDMFKANEKQFGYESSYDKTLQDYTTVLHKDDSEEYRSKQERANRLAAEIEGSTGYKERTAMELDDGLTEEDKFSAVQRPKARMSPGSQQNRSGSPKTQNEGNTGPQKYVPPHLRSNQKPPPRNYNQSSHRPNTPTQGGQRPPMQNISRPPRHIDERDTRMDNRQQSQDVRLSSQDARLSYESRPPRSAAQVVAGTNSQHGNMVSHREVKPESIRTSSPGPPANMVKQPNKDIPRVPSPMVESTQQADDKKPQKSQKSQKINELNEFSANFRLQDTQNVQTNNHGPTQVSEPKPGVQPLNPAASSQPNQQPPVQQVAQPLQSSQTRPIQNVQPSGHPQAPITQVIPPQQLPQVAAQKLNQQQQIILQQQPKPQAAAQQPLRIAEDKKQEFKLNPNAKEFILNPSAKPFTPANSLRKVSLSKTPTPPRPHSRQSQSPTIHTQMAMPQLVAGHPPYTAVLNQMPMVYTPIPLHKKYHKQASNLPPRPQQQGDLQSGQVQAVTGSPLVAPSHYSVAPFPPGSHPGHMMPGPHIMQHHHQMQFVPVQHQPKLPYRSGHPNQIPNVQQSQAQMHSLQDGNPPVFVTPQGPNQVYPGQQQASLYPHHPQSAQQGQHPQGQATHHQMVQSVNHPHPNPQPVQPAQNQNLNQHPQQPPQGHRPTPSPVQHPIQSPSQPTQPGLLLYSVPQHSQQIQGHTPQSQQALTTVMMHQQPQQQQPQPQPYSATSHSITNMTTVHTSPHTHPHVQPNMMYVGGGGGTAGQLHSHTVMLPSGNIQYLQQQQQGGQGQHPPIAAYQQNN
ncbi:uncharacterized protein [Antedon mediterranea]|uniref:uncharacterized protein n=1 Tax=Antedon mediterranea TaxID=105859 RepID=UPI003AF6CEFF